MWKKIRQFFSILTDILIHGRKNEWWSREEGTQRFQARKRAKVKFAKKYGLK